MVKVKSHIFSV